MARKCSEVQPEERARFVRVARPFLVAVYVAGVYDECMRSEAGRELVLRAAPERGLRSVPAWEAADCCRAHRWANALSAAWVSASDDIGPLADCEPLAVLADEFEVVSEPRGPSWLSGLGLSAFDLDAARRRDLPFSDFCTEIGASDQDVRAGAGDNAPAWVWEGRR